MSHGRDSPVRFTTLVFLSSALPRRAVAALPPPCFCRALRPPRLAVLVAAHSGLRASLPAPLSSGRAPSQLGTLFPRGFRCRFPWAPLWLYLYDKRPGAANEDEGARAPTCHTHERPAGKVDAMLLYVAKPALRVSTLCDRLLHPLAGAALVPRFARGPDN
ncbi:hypothetical protein CDD83_2564 [Cordyceps sp. RAO-2017]|nr:hypothetical protein CDD83_2564 [Cordyceps sp. RAO-2017]